MHKDKKLAFLAVGYHMWTTEMPKRAEKNTTHHVIWCTEKDTASLLWYSCQKMYVTWTYHKETSDKLRDVPRKSGPYVEIMADNKIGTICQKTKETKEKKQ